MNMNNWFKDTVILQEDFLQFGKVIHSFQIFYGVVISLQDLQAWKKFNFQKKKQTILIFPTVIYKLWDTQKKKRNTARIGHIIGFELELYHLQALQHGELRRQPLQLIGRQIDMGNQ